MYIPRNTPLRLIFFQTHHPARHEGKQAVKQHGVAKGLAIPLHLFHIITLLSQLAE